MTLLDGDGPALPQTRSTGDTVSSVEERNPRTEVMRNRVDSRAGPPIEAVGERFNDGSSVWSVVRMQQQALAILEVQSWSVGMVALDVATKAASVSVVQTELNDLLGICARLTGEVAALRAALDAAQAVAQQCGVSVVSDLIPRPAPNSESAWLAKPESNPLIEQDVVHFPRETNMAEATQQAIGFIETQGFTAVIEAVDSACKAANVEVVGREKLGGGYIAVVVRGDVAAVRAAIDAAKPRVEGLGKLIATHVIARPSASVLALLPKA